MDTAVFRIAKRAVPCEHYDTCDIQHANGLLLLVDFFLLLLLAAFVPHSLLMTYFYFLCCVSSSPVAQPGMLSLAFLMKRRSQNRVPRAIASTPPASGVPRLTQPS